VLRIEGLDSRRRVRHFRKQSEKQRERWIEIYYNHTALVCVEKTSIRSISIGQYGRCGRFDHLMFSIRVIEHGGSQSKWVKQ